MTIVVEFSCCCFSQVLFLSLSLCLWTGNQDAGNHTTCKQSGEDQSQGARGEGKKGEAEAGDEEAGVTVCLATTDRQRIVVSRQIDSSDHSHCSNTRPVTRLLRLPSPSPSLSLSLPLSVAASRFPLRAYTRRRRVSEGAKRKSKFFVSMPSIRSERGREGEEGGSVSLSCFVSKGVGWEESVRCRSDLLVSCVTKRREPRGWRRRQLMHTHSRRRRRRRRR